MPKRLIGIGDIHGCVDALKGLLEVIEPGADDRLVFLGDYIDRGPGSKSVIDCILALRDKLDVVTLMGNHEEMMLNVLHGRSPLGWWYRYGGRETMESYGLNGDIQGVPAAHESFLRGLVDYHEEDRHFFVHANYVESEALEAQPVEALRWTSLHERMPDVHRSGKTAVVGHSSQKDGEVLSAGHLVCLDTFCVGGGWLTAQDVLSGHTWQVDRHGSPR